MAQRLGYVQALKDLGYDVNANGNSFNPNGLILQINDPEYTHARYFTLSTQPGMIYYVLINKPENESVRLPILKKIEETKERSVYAVGCVLQPVRIGSSLNINVDVPELQWACQADMGGAVYYLFPGVGELLKFAVPALAW